MKFVRTEYFLAFIILLGLIGALVCPPHIAFAQAEAGATPAGTPMLNPNKVALLKWYNANQTAAFPVGNMPYGVVFDGANVWVGSQIDGTITKLRASDGANLGTFTVQGGDTFGMCFDGANIWATNRFSNMVTKTELVMEPTSES